MIDDRVLWQRARSHFDALIELPASARDARLTALERIDPLLRATVARLLAADRSADDALRDYDFTPPHDASAASGPTRAGMHAHDPLGLVGRTVSRFRVTQYVAAGGMGVVYRADDLTLGRVVALKFPLPHQPLEHAVAERFMVEARSAAALDHPNLCTVHEIGESEHGVFLAMPLYAGETLKARLAREGALPLDTALDLATQVATGLAAAHAAGIVHRDLKPGNVMVLPDGTAKVLDFGLAKIRDVDLTTSRMTLGTIGYVAPEQVRGGPADARADLWAIGVMLHEMLTGAPPFAAEHAMAVLHAVLHAEPRAPSAIRPDLPRAVDDVIGTLLRKDPAERHASAEALLADLAALRRGAPLAAPPPRRRAPLQRRPRVIAGVAALGLVAAAATGSALLRRAQDGATRTGDAATRAATSLVWLGDTTTIGTSAELLAALAPAHAGRHVRLRPGTYDVDRPLVVPDGVTLEGAGIMRIGADSLPVGFTDASRTTLRMTANVGGDMLTLGHGATVRGVEIVDLAGRSGNVVSVMSRAPGDRVTATVDQTVVVNPNPLTIGAGGPLGRGLVVLTPNPNMGAAPAPHDGATVTVRMTRSIIRSPGGGGGVFAFNFAPRGRVTLHVSRSAISGTNEGNGGVSRPDPVRDAEVRITSRDNVYRNEWADPCAAPLNGWNLVGGSGAPVPIPVLETARNTLRFDSQGDRIERFTTGVLATGSRRFFAAPLNAAPRDNHVDLRLIGTRIATPACADAGSRGGPGADSAIGRRVAVDLALLGAWVETTVLEPGHGNTVRAEVRDVTGSGRRANRYAHAAADGPLPPGQRGDGNRLTIVGDGAAFARRNRGLDPAPGDAFFERAREPVSAAIPRNGVHPPPRRSP